LTPAEVVRIHVNHLLRMKSHDHRSFLTPENHADPLMRTTPNHRVVQADPIDDHDHRAKTTLMKRKKPTVSIR
jgi:hypothetical protein